MAMHSKEPNDKDHYANKRVRLAGDLIEDLFRVSSNQLARDLKYQLERHHNRKRELRIISCLRPDVLTSKIMHALATGNWVGGRSGVSQLLDRTNLSCSTFTHEKRLLHLLEANLTLRLEICTQLTGEDSVLTKPQKVRIVV